MSDQSPERDDPDEGPLTVPDEDLPEDLQPSEDNPLAQPADDDVPDDVLDDAPEKNNDEDRDDQKD